MSAAIRLHPTWLQWLESEFIQPYFVQLKHFLVAEKEAGKTLYPPGSRIFASFDHTPFDKVKAVILGQDPYHGPGQANGLCFSVADGIRKPPSLQNIFKELHDDLGLPEPASGNLEKWADHGVLLLNATLTVRQSEPGSHQGKGWETFTDRVIKLVSDQKEHVVFILWGKYAQSKEALIDSSRHLILKAAHPSPYSANAGFFGSKPFSKANAWLQQHGIEPINWQL